MCPSPRQWRSSRERLMCGISKRGQNEGARRLALGAKGRMQEGTGSIFHVCVRARHYSVLSCL